MERKDSIYIFVPHHIALWGLGGLWESLLGWHCPYPWGPWHSADQASSRKHCIPKSPEGSPPPHPRLDLAPGLTLWFWIPANPQVLLPNPQLLCLAQMENSQAEGGRQRPDSMPPLSQAKSKVELTKSFESGSYLLSSIIPQLDIHFTLAFWHTVCFSSALFFTTVMLLSDVVYPLPSKPLPTSLSALFSLPCSC